MRKIGEWSTSLPAILMGLLPAVLLVLIGYTGSFTRYIADDYCSVYWAQRFGLLRSVWHWYITWSGRFSAYASDWFVMSMGSRNLGLVPPLMLAAWVAVTVGAAYLFLRSQRNEPENGVTALTLGVAFLFVVLSTIPSIQTSFYWWNGMRSYTLPLLLLTLFAVLYQLGIERLKSRRAIALASVFSLMYFFVNGGLSDVYAVTQLGLMSVLAVWSLIERRRKPASIAILWAAVLGTLLALAAILLSPGNPIREAAFPPHPGLLQMLSIAWRGYAGMLQSFFAAPEKWLALLGGICAAAWTGARMRTLTTRAWVVPAIIGLGLVLSYGAFLPGSWGLSEPPPPRNISVPVFALTAALMIAAFVAGMQLSAKVTAGVLRWGLAGAAIVALNLSAGIGIQKAYTARETYIAYARSWDAGEAQILAAKASGAEVVTVPSVPNWAGLDVISVHAKNYLNQCESGYYGIQVLGDGP